MIQNSSASTCKPRWWSIHIAAAILAMASSVTTTYAGPGCRRPFVNCHSSRNIGAKFFNVVFNRRFSLYTSSNLWWMLAGRHSSDIRIWITACCSNMDKFVISPAMLLPSPMLGRRMTSWSISLFLWRLHASPTGFVLSWFVKFITFVLRCCYFACLAGWSTFSMLYIRSYDLMYPCYNHKMYERFKFSFMCHV